MKGFIYKITNKVTGLSYIGQTRYTVEFRWRQHQHKKDNTYFHNAIQKYGAENFTVETLEECDTADLDSREIFYIAKYNTFENGYNLTIGGGGKRRIVTNSQYEEIKELYLSGFSTYKVGELYEVDRATITKILKIQGVKIRESKGIHINHQEFLELVRDYESGFSLKQLAKRYDCSGPALKEYLIRKGVDVRKKYSIMEDEEGQQNVINDYLTEGSDLRDILRKYHCSYATFTKILSVHGIKMKGKGTSFKLKEAECLEAIRLFGEGMKVQELARKFEVDKSTIYSLFKRYHVNYLTV